MYTENNIQMNKIVVQPVWRSPSFSHSKDFVLNLYAISRDTFGGHSAIHSVVATVGAVLVLREDRCASYLNHIIFV